MAKKTQSELLREKNRKANQKIKRDLIADAELHERVRRGELTAGEAFLSKVKARQKKS